MGMMSSKLQFDHQKHKDKEKRQMKNKQKESQSKALRDTNPGTLVRCSSKEDLNPDFRAAEFHSDTREGRGKDEEITVHST